jgi:UDP-4-amino-4,6-dideoxy-N-acetyl-beta-L-altrosamine N-acetyltransferase
MLSFRRMHEKDQSMVLRWRQLPNIARHMLTTVTHDLDTQLDWFKRISRSERAEYWIIEFNGKPVGVINLSEIDRVNHHATWGLYLGERLSSIEGGLIPIYFYNYVFSRTDLNLNKLHGLVLANNTSMLNMHKMCGYKNIGYYKDHIFREGKFMDVYIVELLREDWLTNGRRFAKHICTFETER